MHAGQKLKLLRNARNLTARQVEQASRRIAAVKEDKRFRISNGWLTQLEQGDSEPSICTIFSLSAIYGVKFLDLVRLYDLDVDKIEKYHTVANPNSTKLLSAKIEDVEPFWPGFVAPSTTLLPGNARVGSLVAHQTNSNSARMAFGYIGLNDFTMYPMIRPGSLVRIDTSQTKVRSVTQHNQFERPIYFVELRHGFAYGWCELQGKELLIIPHHSSPSRIRRFTHIKEAEIVGRVISFDTRCVDDDVRQFERATPFSVSRSDVSAKPRSGGRG